MKKIKLELYSDVVCPWCWIGEARWKRALAERPELEVEQIWRPFRLRPDANPAGEPWEAFVESKFGGWDRARQIFARVIGVGREEGLAFEFEKIASFANTIDAHRLILHAGESGRTWQVAEALFRGYFTEGANLNRTDELVRLAVKGGLDESDARRVLESADSAEAVEESQREATRLGISGVPFGVLNGKFGVSGAQPVDVLVSALDHAAVS